MTREKPMTDTKKHMFSRNRFRERFFISYVLILLIPILAFPYYYRYSYNMIKEKEQEVRSLLVRECSSNMDHAMKQIDDVLLSLEQNTGLKSLLNMAGPPEYGSDKVYQVYQAQKEMSSLIDFANFNFDFSIYLNQADLVFDGSMITYGRQRFYDINTSYASMDYAEFEKQILSVRHYHDIRKNTQLIYKKDAQNDKNYTVKDGILYMETLPLIDRPVYGELGTAVIHINSDLLDSLNYVPVSDHGCTFIQDQNQNLVYSVLGSDYTGELPDLTLDGSEGNFMADIHGKSCLVSYVVSPYNNWRYISVSPMEELTSSLTTLRTLFYAGLCIILLIEFFLCVRFSRSNAAPLEKLLLTLRDNSGYEEAEINSFASLEQYMQNTIRDNTELSTALEEQRIKLNRTFYDQLLAGSFSDSEELMVNAEYLGIDLKAGMYGFLLLSFGASESNLERLTFSDKNIAQFFAEYLTLPQLSFRAQTHTLSMDRLGILVFFPDSDVQRNRELLVREFEPKLSDMRQQFPEEIRCCCGSLYTRIDDLSLAYYEALTAMKQIISQPQQDTICFYDSLAVEPAFYFYPHAIETKLKTLVSAGDQERTDELLEYIFTENLEKRCLSIRSLEAFFTDMQTGIIRILQELKLNLPVHGLFHIRSGTLDIEKECSRIRNAYSFIIAELTSNPPEDDTTACIVAYLEENYGDYSMSVSMAAEHFHMSDSYFSACFKKHTGQTFGKYLENLRINMACDLIRSTNMNIEEISFKVGYSNSLSFRRAFKKVMGVPPSSYR